MKIACISVSQVPSSTANSIQVMKACQALAQLGHQVHLFVPGGQAEVNPAWKEMGTHYGLQSPFEIEWLRSRPGWRRYDFCLAAVRQARRLKADLLYIWPLQAAVLGLTLRLPVLLELHGVPEGRLGPVLFRQYLRLKGRKRLLPITRALVEILERTYHYSFSSSEAVVAPNGVDLERYADLPEPAAARRKLGLPEGLTAGYTGHLYPGRGISLLVELARRCPQIVFLWVGGRPADVQAWRRRLEQEQISNVRLVGFVPNSQLASYQAACDILLMPYERQIEGSSGGNSADYCSPMKMFEYMACERAIVSSDLPVIHEALDETNALLCPPENEPAWEAAIGKLAGDPELRLRLGQTARLKVEHFTWLERARRALDGF